MVDLRNLVYVYGGFAVGALLTFICNVGEVENDVIVIIAGIIIYEVVAFYLMRKYGTKCPKCGVKFALEQYDKKVSSKEDTTVTEIKTIRKYGEKLGTYNKIEDATEYVYEHYMRCKYCGYECKKYSVETYKK